MDLFAEDSDRFIRNMELLTEADEKAYEILNTTEVEYDTSMTMLDRFDEAVRNRILRSNQGKRFRKKNRRQKQAEKHHTVL